MTAHEQFRDDLPLYAVGALTAEEAARMRGHLAECPACREELVGYEEAAAHIALGVEAEMPPARLKGQLMARLEEERTALPAALPAAAPAPVPVPVPVLASAGARTLAAVPGRERASEAERGRRGWGGWFWVPAFAAACLALVSLGLWRGNRGLLEQLRQQEQMTAALQANQAVLERARSLVSALTAGDAQHFTLAAAGAKPQPQAKTVYSSQQHSLVLLAGNLNPLPPNKIYELWLLPASGAAPVAAGTFQPDAGGSATLTLSQFGDGAAAKGFAVTIENTPGSSMPTMPIIMVGTT